MIPCGHSCSIFIFEHTRILIRFEWFSRATAYFIVAFLAGSVYEAAEVYGMSWTWIHHGMGPAVLTSPWVIATFYIVSTFFFILLRKNKVVAFINEVRFDYIGLIITTY